MSQKEKTDKDKKSVITRKKKEVKTDKKDKKTKKDKTESITPREEQNPKDLSQSAPIQPSPEKPPTAITNSARPRPVAKGPALLKKLQKPTETVDVDDFKTLKFATGKSLRTKSEPITSENSAKYLDMLSEVYSVMSAAQITDDDIWIGANKVLPLIKHFNKEIKIAEIFPSSLVCFNFPKTPNFEGIPSKTYKIDRRMPIYRIIQNVFGRIGKAEEASRYTLSTVDGFTLPPEHALANYGLGSILQNWELNFVPLRAKLESQQTAVADSDAQRFSVLILFEHNLTLSRYLLPASNQIDQVIKSLKDKIESLSNFSSEAITLKTFNEEVLDKNKKLEDYGLGKNLERLELRLCVEGLGSTTHNKPEKIEKYKKESDYLKQENARIQQELVEVQNNAAAAQDKLTKELRRMGNLKNRIDEERQEVKQKLEEYQKEIEDLKAKLDESSHHSTISEKLQAELNLEKEKSSSIEQLRIELASLKLELEAEKTKSTDLRSEVEELKNANANKNNSKNETSELESELEEVKARNESLKKQVDDYKRFIDSLAEVDDESEQDHEPKANVKEAVATENKNIIEPVSETLANVENKNEINQTDKPTHVNAPEIAHVEPTPVKTNEEVKTEHNVIEESKSIHVEPKIEEKKEQSPRPTTEKQEVINEQKTVTHEEPPEEPDTTELYRQWAHEVIDVSSEAADEDYSDWSAKQVLGPPKITSYGDSGFSWAPFDTNAGHEWITVKFRARVYISEILILENFNPGAINKVEVKNGALWEPIWEQEAKAAPAELRVLTVKPKRKLKFPSDSIRIHLETSNVGTEWNEIAAIQLAGSLVEGDPIPPPEPEKPPPPPPPKPFNSTTKSAPLPPPPPTKLEFDPSLMQGASLLGFITSAKSNLKKAEGDKAFQKPKEQASDLMSALQKRFNAVHGKGLDAEDLEDDWDEDEWEEGIKKSDATWANDKEDIL